tara:strand:- start:1237 stop:1761 length:525 start_codon:yes stop_codon:yes gene_type:complete
MEKKIKNMIQKVKASDDGIIKAFGQVIPKNQSSKYKAQDFASLTVGDRKLFDTTKQSLSDIFDLGFLMEEKSIDEAYEFLVTDVIPKMKEAQEIGEDDYHSLIIFNSPLLEVQKINERTALYLQDDKGPLTDLISCPRCGASKVRHEKIQTRSADEGATSVFTCVVCNWNLTQS